jgi:DNA-binding MarR family transcriptional regulator
MEKVPPLQKFSGVVSIQEEIGALIADLARKHRTRFDQRAKALGLTRPQWRILNNVLHVEGASQSFLVQKLEVEHITVSRLLDNLAKMGWIERRVDPNDKRARLIYATEKAKPLLKQIEKVRAKVEEELFGSLTEPDLKKLRSLLHKINDRYNALDRIDA